MHDFAVQSGVGAPCNGEDFPRYSLVSMENLQNSTFQDGHVFPQTLPYDGLQPHENVVYHVRCYRWWVHSTGSHSS